jgi:hypothetical protein
MAKGNVVSAQGNNARTDAVSERIRFLMSQGNVAGARRIVDSVLASTASSESRFGDALFLRAVLTPSTDSARRDLLRVVVEYPQSAIMEEVLVRLAEIEVGAGDKSSARRHLERLVRDHLSTDRGVKAAHQFAEMLLAEGATLPACAVLDSARVHVSPGNIELTNQIAYTGRLCGQARAAAQPRPVEPPVNTLADSVAVRSPRVASPKEGSRNRGAPSGIDGWSVQVAAYAVRGDALRLAARLSARGYDARVTAIAPFRVRIGRYSSRAAALDVVARLKAEKTEAIIVVAERM